MMMQPVMAQMLGQFGQGMQFYCFPGRDDQNQPPTRSQKARILHGHASSNKDYQWRLPLGSLLPNKFDPQSHEEFPGNYIYNPFTGAKLIDVPPDKKRAQRSRHAALCEALPINSRHYSIK